MRSTDLRRRLNELERTDETNKPLKIRTHWMSDESGLCYYLTGKKADPRPGLISTYWSQEPPNDDDFKLRMLAQHTKAELEGFRQTWSRSNHERDRLALAEMDRLLLKLDEGNGD